MNLVTVPALALVLPEALPVAVITLGLSISIGMLRHEHHALDRVGLAWILAGRVPGSVVGAWVVAVASTTVLEALAGAVVLAMVLASVAMPVRSDERRVGTECVCARSSRGSQKHEKKKN